MAGQKIFSIYLDLGEIVGLLVPVEAEIPLVPLAVCQSSVTPAISKVSQLCKARVPFFIPIVLK